LKAISAAVTVMAPPMRVAVFHLEVLKASADGDRSD
jgi:hypothetical protein